MRLRTRLALVTGGAVTGIVALLAGTVFLAERQDLLQRADADLQREAAAIVGELVGGAAPDAAIDAHQPRAYEALAQVVDEDGDVAPLHAADITLPVTGRVMEVAAGSRDRFVTTVELDGVDYRVLVAPGDAGALMVGRSIDDVDDRLAALAVDLALVAVAGFGAAVLLGGLVAGSALRSISRLSASVADVTDARTLRRRLRVDGDDEISRLSGRINTMLDALEDARRSQNQLVADASHELRTPLTSILTNLEVMEDGHRLAEDERLRLRADVRDEVLGLSAAVDDLLDLARDGAPTGPFDDDVALDLLVADVVDAARRRWPDRVIACTAEPCIVVGDRSQLHRAFTNLVENAAKWSTPGGHVEVTLTADAVTVRDHGPGIPPDELPRVFERFYRATSARGLPGAGLGLAIVHKVVTDHGWRVEAANDPAGGAVFRVVLTGATPGRRVGPGEVPARRPGRRVAGLPLGALAGSGAGTLAVAALAVLLVVHEGGAGAGAPVPLVGLNGVLDRCGRQYCVGAAVADFGPSWYVADTHARYDFDADGVRDLLTDELDGLVGTQVRLETDGGSLDQDVYSINGLPFRDLHGQLPAPAPAP